MELWNSEIEKKFFTASLKNFAAVEDLFYLLDNQYFAYVPNNIKGNKAVLNSRNSLIGHFTEKWTRELLSPVAKKFGLFAINNVECEEIGLSKKSSADLAFCTTNDSLQRPENIKLIFEIKMSIVSNYTFSSGQIKLIGDYKSHKGNPSLLRSDSMLKAIGKAINIRVSSIKSRNIPIIIIGNSPITDHYTHKVDYLKIAGVIQGFWSLNPQPTLSKCILGTKGKGFRTISDINSLEILCNELLHQGMNYFSSMISKPKLGELIRIANLETTDIKKAEKFLDLLNNQ